MRDEAFERLYAEHAGPLFGFLAYRTGDQALAEDLLTDTFERALRARRRYDHRRGSEKNWLYSIALNLLRDAKRRQAVADRALATLAASPPGFVDEGQAAQMRVDLERALGELGPEEREAISLRYGADLSLPEMARLLRIPLTTAEGRVYRALRKLKVQMAERGAS